MNGVDIQSEIRDPNRSGYGHAYEKSGSIWSEYDKINGYGYGLSSIRSEPDPLTSLTLTINIYFTTYMFNLAKGID